MRIIAGVKPTSVRKNQPKKVRVRSQNGGNEDGCHLIGKPLDGRFGSLRLFHQTYDLRQHRARSDLGSATCSSPAC